MTDADQPLDLDTGQPADDDGSIKARVDWLAGVGRLADALQDEAWSCPLCFVTGMPHENGCPDCETVLHTSTMLRAFVRSRRAEVRPDAVVGAQP